MGSVKAGEAHIGVDAGGDGLNAQLQRGQRGLVAHLSGHPLIHRGIARAQVCAGGPGDRGTGEESAGFDVVAVASVGGGVPQVAQYQQFGLV